ncbi:tRNA-specific adenosine deaminase subunit TAD3 [Candida viswanathii]|uniref:tRNA-specific adenosine deaminase subunit TAD3 n=1 Tax=Candida viswanathii TaxID=5486 RepID=A0A367XRR8_9ASCO|nr:tRNA-specific adenosine deaminase subunit TAD3 [Candida viswanathii]
MSQRQALDGIHQEYFPLDESTELGHFKRIRKVGDHLQVLICKYESESQTIEISDFASEVSLELSISNLAVIGVPRHVPSTKELTQLWGEEYWPITWKGNPNHQFLNSVEFDMSQETAMVNELLDSLHDDSLSSADYSVLGH